MPAHPAALDYLTALQGGWQMLGNDSFGDCAAVTWASVRRMMTAILGGAEHYPTLDQVVELYKTQNPDFDPNGDPNVNGPGSQAEGGMDLQTLFEYLQKNPGPDGAKVVAFPAVDPKNPAEVKAAIAIFGYVWTGTMVQAANEEQFSKGELWQYAPSSPVVGRHSIITGGYGPEPIETDPIPALGGDEKFITWAAETSFEDKFWQHEVDEAWVVIWPEHLGTNSFREGIDGAALAAAYQAITSRQLPAT